MKNNDKLGFRSRIDKWLWVTRYFKTRTLATEAVSSGHIRLNGNRVKSSKLILIGDNIVITKNKLQYDVTVVAIAATRVSATVARTLYLESEASILKRENAIKDAKFYNTGFDEGKTKPNKRQRRQIHKFTGKMK